MKQYPAIEFIARNGRRVAWVAGAGLGVAGMAAAFVQQSATHAAIGLLAGVAAWGVLRVAAEVVEVVAETLLPR